MAARRILIVDDNPSVREMLRDVLNGGGLLTVEASSCQEALRFMEDGASTIDLVIDDLDMPALSGIDLLRTLRRNYPSLPVIMLSDMTDTRLMMDIIHMGAADLVAKPLRSNGLLTAIRCAISARLCPPAWRESMA